MVRALKATGRCDYSDDELKSMSIGQIERLLKLADVPAPPTYEGVPVPRAAASSKGTPPAPVGLVSALGKKQ